MNLRAQLESRELVVFLGTGGVGKTTVAAAAALEAAKGRRTLVLTIDPARRLADSLGIKVGNEDVEVRPNLHARMLDTKATLDELIERYAGSPETMKRIFKSRFYEELSNAFAGSEEFVAMGALHDILEDGAYDLVVVDTPPSRHAVDFLSTNARLIRVFESGLVKYLFKPTRILRIGGGYLANVLARWTSQEYLEEFSEFVMTFDEMFRDMEARVRRMQEILYDPARTSINLVTSPESESVTMARELHREITTDVGLEVSACIVNRAHFRLGELDALRDLASPGDARDHAVQRLSKHAGASEAGAIRFLEDATRAATFYGAVAQEHEANIAKLKQSFRGVEFEVVPTLPQSVHDLAGLERFASRLFAREGVERGADAA